MDKVKFPLQHAQAIVLQGNYSGSAADFSVLARLTHTELLEQECAIPHAVCEDIGQQPPDGLVPMYISKVVDAFYDQSTRQCRLYVKRPEYLERHPLGVFIWQMSLIGASAAAIMRGSKVHLMHCAMLEKANRALLLCGESGIGKSTSVRRFKAAGGTAISDDMVMLEHASDGKLYAYHLPTWSACREGLEGLDYPFAPPLEVVGVLAISRDEQCESVKSISRAEFFAQLYRCSFFHYLWSCGNLPEAEKNLLASVIQESTGKMVSRFAPQAFFANLNGDIASTLKGLL